MAASYPKFRFLRNLSNRLSQIQCSKNRFLSTNQIYIEEFGDPKTVLRKRSSKLPNLANDEVLIKMLMSPINPSDVNTIEGTYFVKPPLPTVLGNEGVGKIIEVGQQVKGLSPGDIVIPSKTCTGTWQTFRISQQEDIIKLPNDVPTLSAATISVNPSSAYRMLKDYVKLSPGDLIIQNGANSGVGIGVIQLANHWKIKTINIIRDRPDFETIDNYLKGLGADYVVTEDFVRKPEMKELIKSLPSSPKLGLNCVGGASAIELIRHIGHGGAIVTYGGMSKRPVTVPTGALIFKEVKLFGYWNTQWIADEKHKLARLEMFAELCDLIKSNKFLPPKCEFYELDDYEEAMLAALKGFKGNKIVFKME